MDTFEHFQNWRITGEEVDVCISGSYSITPGSKATRHEPEDYPDVEIYDLTVELGSGRIITPPSSFNSRFIEAHIDWETLITEILNDYSNNEEAAYYDAADNYYQQLKDDGRI